MHLWWDKFVSTIVINQQGFALVCFIWYTLFLGIKICGGCSLDGRQENGIFVKRVLPGGLADIDGKKSHLKGIHNFWNTVQDVFQKIFFHYKPMENISIKPNIHVVL